MDSTEQFKLSYETDVTETMKIEEHARRKSHSFFKADQAIENGV